MVTPPKSLLRRGLHSKKVKQSPRKITAMNLLLSSILLSLLGTDNALGYFADHCDVKSGTRQAVIQYLPEKHSIWAWRERVNADGSVCIALDFPQTKTLSQTAAQQLYQAMAKQQAENAKQLAPTQEIQLSGGDYSKTWQLSELPPNAHSGPETTLEAGCAARKPFGPRFSLRFYWKVVAQLREAS
jgi:hypothetical protein